MTTEEVFLADILANPEDDGLRMIYADWLDENGQNARADFIRVQIEMVSAGPSDPVEDPGLVKTQRWAWLCRREKELMEDNDFVDFPGWVEQWEFTRGFVSAVRLMCRDWMYHGLQLVQQYPLERVELSDKQPIVVTLNGNFHYARWTLEDSTVNRMEGLPDELWTAMDIRATYSSIQNAMGALSAGCLRWAKAQPVPASQSPPVSS